MKLTLPYHDVRRFASWNCTLHRMLAGSMLFDLSYSNELPAMSKDLGGRRAENFSVFAIDDVLIGLDTWDTGDPTSIAAARGAFHPRARGTRTLKGLDLILKIQWMPNMKWPADLDDERVVPWTMFPSREFPLGAFQWRPGKHRYVAAVTGVMRHRRGEWFEMAKASSDWFTCGKSDLDMRQWVGALQQCRWGLSLGGKRGTDMKNRRESEFISCGMPLALNYIPHYPFAFEPDVHFLYLPDASHVERLLAKEAIPFAQRSRELWRNHFSPHGMTVTLLRLLRQHRLLC